MMFDRIAEGRYWDKPLSLVSGCTPCSPGCEHCWAAAMEHRFHKTEDDYMPGQYHHLTTKGKFNGKIQIHPERLDIPLRRKKPTVYAVWNDLFHPRVPPSFQNEAWKIMAQAYQHIFLVLTKRVHLMMAVMKMNPKRIQPPNVWLGCTVVNQQEADEKIPILLQIQAAVRWISIEPMLGEIYLLAVPAKNVSGYAGLKLSDMLHLVIVGGETGHGARPMNPEWAIDVKNQCKAAGVPFFFKGHGKYRGSYPGFYVSSGRLLEGQEWNELPEEK